VTAKEGGKFHLEMVEINPLKGLQIREREKSAEVALDLGEVVGGRGKLKGHSRRMDKHALRPQVDTFASQIDAPENLCFATQKPD
jgi:hypothetical protein